MSGEAFEPIKCQTQQFGSISFCFFLLYVEHLKIQDPPFSINLFNNVIEEMIIEGSIIHIDSERKRIDCQTDTSVIDTIIC